MITGEMHFAVPADFDPAPLIEGLTNVETPEPPTWTAKSRTFFDSFDWRLFGQDTVVVEEAGGQRTDLVLLSLSSGRPVATFTGTSAPRFVADLPLSPMRARLADSLEMRALLPVVLVESRHRSWEVRDSRDKIIARVTQESWTAAKPAPTVSRRSKKKTSEAKPSPHSQITVMPIKGFEADCRTLVKALRKESGVRPETKPLYLLALDAIGRAPGDYSSKLNLKFAPEMRSDFVLRHTLAHLLGTLQINLDGTREDLDSEFLHDFRVAVRRARSALGQLKGILPQEETQRLRRELAWLGQATGPKRDLDVALLKYDDYRNALDEPHRSGLEPLRKFLSRQDGEIRKELRRDLRSQRFLRLLKDWRTLAAEPAETDASRAATPIGQLSTARIGKAYRRVLRDGGRIKPKTPAEALHELRKDCKKLRYLMEFFRSLYPDADIKQAIKVLKGLQENLGDFQDFEVQQDQLRGYAREMSEASLMRPGTQEAILALVQQLHERQIAARQEFAERFAAFSAKPNRALFEGLFGPQEKKLAKRSTSKRNASDKARRTAKGKARRTAPRKADAR